MVCSKCMYPSIMKNIAEDSIRMAIERSEIKWAKVDTKKLVRHFDERLMVPDMFVLFGQNSYTHYSVVYLDCSQVRKISKSIHEIFHRT